VDSQQPVGLTVDDDLRRSRVTVFFRLFLAIPHAIWFALWSALIIVLAIVGWFAALFTGRLPGGLHRFFCSYVRYSTRFFAYLYLVANPYPQFTGDLHEGYPLDVRLPDPGPLTRWKVLLRLVLAIPAMIVSFALTGGGFGTGRTDGKSVGAQVNGVTAVAAVFGWFASVARGTMPRGLRDAGAFALGYRAQVLAYLLLLTDRYPNADPHTLLTSLEPPRPHPVHLEGDALDLRRSRATTFFRLPLVIPHLVWLLLWTVPAVVAAVSQWFVALVRGRPARVLHRFLARYVRYGFHVYAFAAMASNPFPGFSGKPGVNPLDLVLPGPSRQNRWKTFFRFILAVPALVIGGALGSALVAAAILTWFVALATGRAPEGLRNLAAWSLRYSGQSNAYLLLLTDVYPHSSPLEGVEPDGDEHESPVLPTELHAEPVA
jgi:hypothetical protein